MVKGERHYDCKKRLIMLAMFYYSNFIDNKY